MPVIRTTPEQDGQRTPAWRSDERWPSRWDARDLWPSGGDGECPRTLAEIAVSLRLDEEWRPGLYPSSMVLPSREETLRRENAELQERVRALEAREKEAAPRLERLSAIEAELEGTRERLDTFREVLLKMAEAKAEAERVWKERAEQRAHLTREGLRAIYETGYSMGAKELETWKNKAAGLEERLAEVEEARQQLQAQINLLRRHSRARHEEILRRAMQIPLPQFTTGELARFLDIHVSRASQICSDLQERGWVQKRRRGLWIKVPAPPPPPSTRSSVTANL